MNEIPEELMYLLRAINLIAIHNSTLGGSTAYRLRKFTYSAIKESSSSYLNFGYLLLKFYLVILKLEAKQLYLKIE